MRSQASNAVVRRSFLARLTGFGTAIAGVVALPSAAVAQSTSAPTHPADAWLDDLKGQHKTIFDCTSVENGGMGWTFARNFLTANTGPIYGLKDSDVNAIVCVRHSSSVYGFNDAMWAKYKLGESQKVIENGVAATKNAHANVANADLKANLVTSTARVVAAGVIVTNRAQEKGFTYTYVG